MSGRELRGLAAAVSPASHAWGIRAGGGGPLASPASPGGRPVGRGSALPRLAPLAERVFWGQSGHKKRNPVTDRPIRSQPLCKHTVVDSAESTRPFDERPLLVGAFLQEQPPQGLKCASPEPHASLQGGGGSDGGGTLQRIGPRYRPDIGPTRFARYRGPIQARYRAS